jgi:rhodanese-related sulfurtransferase
MSRFQTLSPAEFAAALDASPRPFILDVREKDVFETGHVPGSRWVQVHELVARRAELPHSRIARVLVVGEPGKRIEAAANFLALLNYSDVAVLDGGFPAWTGPVETGPPPERRPPGPELRVI